jgi:hypothetical protein
MPLFKIRRAMPGASMQDVEAAGLRAAFCTYAFGGEVRWHRSYFDAAAGEIHCIYEATSPEQLQRHAALAHLSCDEVVEVTEVLAHAFYEEAESEGGAAAPMAQDLLGAEPGQQA